MWPIAQVANTTVYFEAMVDYEFENNMDKFMQDSLTLSAKAGIAWIPSPLRRIQLEWQKFEGQKGLRSQRRYYANCSIGWRLNRSSFISLRSISIPVSARPLTNTNVKKTSLRLGLFDSCGC